MRAARSNGALLATASRSAAARRPVPAGSIDRRRSRDAPCLARTTARLAPLRARHLDRSRRQLLALGLRHVRPPWRPASRRTPAGGSTRRRSVDNPRAPTTQESVFVLPYVPKHRFLRRSAVTSGTDRLSRPKVAPQLQDRAGFRCAAATLATTLVGVREQTPEESQRCSPTRI